MTRLVKSFCAALIAIIVCGGLIVAGWRIVDVTLMWLTVQMGSPELAAGTFFVAMVFCAAWISLYRMLK